MDFLPVVAHGLSAVSSGMKIVDGLKVPKSDRTQIIVNINNPIIHIHGPQIHNTIELTPAASQGPERDLSDLEITCLCFICFSLTLSFALWWFVQAGRWLFKDFPF